MTVEDRLRGFTRAIDTAMQPIRPLNLSPASEPARPRARRPGGERRMPGWLVPLTAAVTIAAVAAGTVVIRDISHATPQTAQPWVITLRPGPAGSGSATDPEALPEYFAALAHPQSGMPGPHGGLSTTPLPDPVVIGQTRTGRVQATITPPDGDSFIGVTGAGDNRTFVLDAVPRPANPFTQGGPHRWYLLKITSGITTTALLTRLPIPAVPASDQVGGIALSRDGAKLAILSQAGSDAPATGQLSVLVYATATGALLHGWTATDRSHGLYAYSSGSQPVNNHNLSWAADGNHLAFMYGNYRNADSSLSLRMLDLTRPGSHLLTDSRTILRVTAAATRKPAIRCGTLGITADGRTAVCGASLPRVAPTGIILDAYVRPAVWTGCAAPSDLNYPGIAEISLASHTLTKVLYQVKPACIGDGTSTILWASPSGASVLSYVGYTDDPSMKAHVAAVFVSHGTVTGLTWPRAASVLYYAAF
jgi:hypothetical protein